MSNSSSSSSSSSSVQHASSPLAAKASEVETQITQHHLPTFSTLPYELYELIFSYSSPRDLIRCVTLSKKFYEMINPSSYQGRHTWELVRKRLALPDPSILDITDYEFLKAYHSRTCSFCSNLTRFKGRRCWALHGYRFCKKCVKEKTVCVDQLHNINPDQYIHLPNWLDGNGKKWYFKPDILDHIPDESEIAELEEKREAIMNFVMDLKRAEDRIVSCAFHYAWKKLEFSRTKVVKYQLEIPLKWK